MLGCRPLLFEEDRRDLRSERERDYDRVSLGVLNYRKAITHTDNSMGIGYPDVSCYFA